MTMLEYRRPTPLILVKANMIFSFPSTFVLRRRRMCWNAFLSGTTRAMAVVLSLFGDANVCGGGATQIDSHVSQFPRARLGFPSQLKIMSAKYSHTNPGRKKTTLSTHSLVHHHLPFPPSPVRVNSPARHQSKWPSHGVTSSPTIATRASQPAQSVARSRRTNGSRQRDGQRPVSECRNGRTACRENKSVWEQQRSRETSGGCMH